MRDIAFIDIVWNQQGQLLLNYSDRANTPANLQREHMALSVPLFCACEMCVLEPRICNQLCQSTYDITVNGALSPRPINGVLKEARLDLKEISSATDENCLLPCSTLN
jgi:hypothetical protein